MKKILFTFLIFSSTLFAQAQLYMGAGYIYANESRTSDSSAKINNNGVKIKFGYGEQKAYAVEFSLNYIDNNSALLSTDDQEKYGFDVELMKAWDFDIYALPFIRVGFGAGQMSSTARKDQSSISYGSFNGTLGTLVPLSESFELEFAYTYKNITYQKKQASNANYPRTHQNDIYAGINYRF